MKKPKIALLIPRYGVVDRGAEVLVSELAKRLSVDFAVTIYARKRNKNDHTKSSFSSSNNRFRVVQVPSLSEPNKIVNFFHSLNPKLASFLNKRFLDPFGIENLSFCIMIFPHLVFGKYNIIFPHNGIWGAITSRIVRFLVGTPYIIKSTGGIEPPVARQKPNTFVCETPVIFNWYKKYFPDIKLKLIPNGVDLTKFSPKVKPVTLKLKKPIYLCVGALIPSKRVDLAILAVAKLNKGCLIIIGVGPLKERLIELGRKKLGNSRFLLIDVTQGQIPNYYRFADVFTLPSYEEPFGIVYLEAMASNLPIVATNDPQRKYIIGDAGLFADVEDLNQYSKALERVIKKKFGSTPRKQAKKFSWVKVSKLYSNLIFDVIKDPNSRSI